MKQLVAVVVAVFLFTALADSDLEARVAELEQRLASIEVRLTTPPPPATTEVVDGFTFERLGLHQPSSNYAEVVGEVTSQDEYDRVTFRVTFYSEDGVILGTDTYSVENVGNAPRTFSVLVRGVVIGDVHSMGMQVERVR